MTGKAQVSPIRYSGSVDILHCFQVKKWHEHGSNLFESNLSSSFHISVLNIALLKLIETPKSSLAFKVPIIFASSSRPIPSQLEISCCLSYRCHFDLREPTINWWLHREREQLASP